MAAVDNSAWDGPAAMMGCSQSNDPAAAFRAICAAEHTVGTPEQRQHWALPHHRSPGDAPNADGVRQALGRVPQVQDITDAERARARAHLEEHMSAIQDSENAAAPVGSVRFDTLRDAYEVRAQPQGYELRAAEDGSMMMRGHFAVFNQWTEINSGTEGHFMERIAPGAFKRTIQNNANQMRVLFNHGHDVTMGDQVLGKITDLREDPQGAAYEVQLFPGVPQLIKDGLRANQYGSSFRFRVVRQQINEHPERSDANPDGLPERTITEAKVMEFGPVTWPAYAGATASARSMTDEYITEHIGFNKLRQFATSTTLTETETPVEAPASSTAAAASRSETQPTSEPQKGSETEVDSNLSLDELRARVAEIGTDLQRIDAEAGTETLGEAQRAEFDALVKERDEALKRIADKERRLEAIGKVPEPQRERVWSAPNVIKDRTDADIYDLSQIRTSFDNPQAAAAELRDRAKRAIERGRYPHVGREATKEDMQERVEGLLDNLDSGTDNQIARRILYTGHPDYEPAFFKAITGRGITSREAAALERTNTLTQTMAGYAMPFTLDPTVVLNSNGTINPIRQLANVVQVTGQTWNGVQSGGITAGFLAAETEASDNGPTLTQDAITVLKAAAFVPFSFEAENWNDIRNELTTEFRDSKDVLEATKFTVGTGTTEPQGFMKATYLATTAATATIALADLDTLADSLAPRYQSNAVWMANRKFYSKVRQLGRTAGVSDEWAPEREGFPSQLLGYPIYQASDVVSTLTTSAALVAALGDFSKGYTIVDRIGMNVEYIPNLVGSNHRPIGSRGVFAWWMTNGAVRVTNALRLLKVL